VDVCDSLIYKNKTQNNSEEDMKLGYGIIAVISVLFYSFVETRANAQDICGDTTLMASGQHSNKIFAKKLAGAIWRRCAFEIYGHRAWSYWGRAIKKGGSTCYPTTFYSRSRRYRARYKSIDCGSRGDDVGMWICFVEAIPCKRR
jgi:hypothetical protein